MVSNWQPDQRAGPAVRVSDAGSVPARAQRRVGALRRSTLAMIVLLLAQFALGMVVNLYVTMPAGAKGGPLTGFGRALSQGAPALAIHVVLGFLLILTAIGVLVRAIQLRGAGVVVAGVIGLLSLVAAAFNGAAFVAKSNDFSSLLMALLSVVALLVYVLALYTLIGNRAQET